MVNWYEMNESERIKKIYSKFTIKKFWDWWSDNQYRVMEIRIKDYLMNSFKDYRASLVICEDIIKQNLIKKKVGEFITILLLDPLKK